MNSYSLMVVVSPSYGYFFSNGVHFNSHKRPNNADLSEIATIALRFCGLEFAWKQNELIHTNYSCWWTGKQVDINHLTQLLTVIFHKSCSMANSWFSQQSEQLAQSCVDVCFCDGSRVHSCLWLWPQLPLVWYRLPYRPSGVRVLAAASRALFLPLKTVLGPRNGLFSWLHFI